MKSYIYILFVLLGISCQNISPVENEITILNSARGYDMKMLSKYGVKPETYIFEKYSIDSLQYAKNVSYYSSDIENYKDMYLSIQKRVEEEFSHYDSLSKIEKKVKDSLRKLKSKKIKREKDSIKMLDSIAGKKKK